MRSTCMVIVILLVLVGCVDMSSNSSKTELEGIWVSGCLSDGSVNVIKKVDVTGDEIGLEWSYYDETDNQTCSTIKDVLTFSGDNISITDNSTIKILSFSNQQSTLTPKSVAELNNYNSINRCGFSDWEINVAKDVTGKNIPNCEFPNAGANFKLQYSLQGENLNLTVFSDTRTYTKQ